MMGALHGPTLPGGRGGGRRFRKKRSAAKEKEDALASVPGRVKLLEEAALQRPPPTTWCIADRKKGDKEEKAVVSEAGYWERRNRKLSQQGVASETTILRGCNVYFNGRTGDKDIIALKALVQRHGGTVTNGVSSHVTHVVGTNTSGTKANQYLRKSRMSWKFVSPQWLLDSVAAAKQQPAYLYSIIHSADQPTVVDMFRRDRGGSASTAMASDADASALPAALPPTSARPAAMPPTPALSASTSTTVASTPTSSYLARKKRRRRGSKRASTRRVKRRTESSSVIDLT